MARVIISAGHTQAEPGAVSDDLREVDLTRKIASKVVSKLRDQGIIVLSVPPELDLPARIDWINRTGYREETEDVCVEFHVNDGGKSGIEGWYKEKGDNKSKDLVEDILEEVAKKTSLSNQGAKSEYDHPLQRLAFVHDTVPTSALIECLYIDNPDDQKFLRDDSKLDSLAEGVVDGILEFFDIDKSQAVKPKPRQNFNLPSSQPFRQTMPSPYPSSLGTPTFGGIGSSGYAGGMTRQAPEYDQKAVQSKEDRKQMIKNKYQQILGRKVNEQDLNYFINLSLSEDQMVKRLVESQEHADLVRDAQECKSIKPEYEKQKTELQRLKVACNDREKIIEQQNELINQKNRSIREFQGQENQTAQPSGSLPSDSYAAVPTDISEIGYQEVQPPREGFFDKILRKLNDIFD